MKLSRSQLEELENQLAGRGGNDNIDDLPSLDSMDDVQITNLVRTLQSEFVVMT